MSRAKKTKRTKAYSAAHSYRRIGELLNHADKQLGIKPKRIGYGDKQRKEATK